MKKRKYRGKKEEKEVTIGEAFLFQLVSIFSYFGREKENEKRIRKEEIRGKKKKMG